MAPRELTDEEVFGSAPIAPMQGELSDEQVFGKAAAPIDMGAGAPYGVRSAVGGARQMQDKLATLRRYAPDAEVYDNDNFIFTDPKTGKRVLYNPKGLDIGDFASITSEIASGLGGTAAALAATPPAVAGAIPTGGASLTTIPVAFGLGAAGGSELENLVQTQLGKRVDTRGTLQHGADVVGDVLLNAIGARAGEIAAPYVEKGVGFVKNKGGELLRDTSSKSIPGLYNPNPMNKGEKLLTQALTDDELTARSVAARLANAKKTGAPVKAIDVAEKDIGGVPMAGRNIQGIADAAANQPGKAPTIAAKTATRKYTQHDRILGYLDDGLGKSDFYDVSDDILKNIETKSTAAREKALTYGKNIRSMEVNELLSRPAGRKALSYAKEMAADAGVDMAEVDATGRAKYLNTRSLDWVKRALDQMINSEEGKNQVTGKITERGRLWIGIKNKISDTIKAQNPAYKEWMETYADEASRKNALDSGRKFLNEDIEVLLKQYRGYGQAEKDAFKTGVKRALQDKIISAPDSADAVKRIWNENTRKKLRPLFDTQSSWRSFVKQMEIEKRMATVDQKILGGSPTMPRQQYSQAITEAGIPTRGEVLKAVVNPQGAATDKAMMVMTKSLQKKVNKMSAETAEQVMGYLYSDDPGKWIKLQGLIDANGLNPKQTYKTIQQLPVAPAIKRELADILRATGGGVATNTGDRK